MPLADRQAHWEGYYLGRDVPDLPSQFAIFALGESGPSAVLDVGCGSGRDSFYFASQGVRTVGVDGSAAAIELCQKRSANRPLQFIRGDVGDGGFADLLQPLLPHEKGLLVYARFFLHAITDDEERAFLRHVSRLLRYPDDLLAVEFRTLRDRALNKVTPDHYRRFVDPTELVIRATGVGLRCCYAVEGFGMAKYREDDAYVARMLFRRAE